MIQKVGQCIALAVDLIQPHILRLSHPKSGEKIPNSFNMQLAQKTSSIFKIGFAYSNSHPIYMGFIKVTESIVMTTTVVFA